MTVMLPERIETWLSEVEELPTLPEVPTQVLQMAGDDEIPLSDIAQVIEHDPALTTNVLRVANSAYYGFSHRVSTMHAALPLLGLNEVVNLVCSVAVVTAFGPATPGLDLNGDLFWRHSVGCGLAAKLLSKRFKFDVGGSEFIAGLIHDIGIVVCAQYLPGQFRQIREVMDHTQCPMQAAEQEVLGTTHSEIGAWIARRWQLPPLLVESLRFHHAPLDALAQAEATDEPGLAAVVHLADRVAAEPALEFGESLSTLPPLEQDVAWRIILAESPDLRADEVDEYAKAFADEQPRVVALLSAVS